jgi:hypothetical protein
VICVLRPRVTSVLNPDPARQSNALPNFTAQSRPLPRVWLWRRVALVVPAVNWSVISTLRAGCHLYLAPTPTGPFRAGPMLVWGLRCKQILFDSLSRPKQSLLNFPFFRSSICHDHRVPR